jgi:hypothetical protein
MTASRLASNAKEWFGRYALSDPYGQLIRDSASGLDCTDQELRRVRDALSSDPSIWERMRDGTVEDLIERIASYLPPTERRTASQSRALARVIAVALLDFGVASMDEGHNRLITKARLGRIEGKVKKP